MAKAELSELPTEANLLADLPQVKVVFPNFIRIKEMI
jgi:hypothetical protein